MKHFLFFIFFIISKTALSFEYKISTASIVYNLDSFENTLKLKSKFDNESYLHALFTLEFNRLFFSSEKYGNNLSEINLLVDGFKNKQNVACSNLFNAIQKFRQKKSLDDVSTLLYSSINYFEQNKDTLATIIAYSRLIDLHMSYRNHEKKENPNLIDEQYHICKIMATQSNNLYCKLFFYFLSIRYYNYWKKDIGQVKSFCSKGVEAINNSNNKKLKVIESYFNYYNGMFFMQKGLYDSSVFYLKKSVQNVHPQANDNISSYLILADIMYKNNLIDSAIAMLKIVKFKMGNNYDNLYNLNTYWGINIRIFNLQKKYDSSVICFKIKDSIDDVIREEMYKIPMQKLNDEYNVLNLKVEKNEVEKQNIKFKTYAMAGLILFASAIFIAITIGKKNKKQKEFIAFKSQIESVISHDLKSPLVGLTQLYSQYNYWVKKNEPIQIEKISYRIDEASVNMVNLINNVLLWTNDDNATIKTTNLFNACNNCLELYASIIEANNITVLNTIDKSIVISESYNSIELIIRNWLDNIIKHAKPSNIKLSTMPQSNLQLSIVIEDNGSAAQEAYINIQSILNGSSKNVTNAYGFGLHLIKDFAIKNNWKIQLSNKEKFNECCIKNITYTTSAI